MWESGVEEALTVGVPYDFYWGEMTPKLFSKYIKAYEKRLQQQLNILDTANHVLGLYIKSAISDTLAGKNKYPTEPFIEKAMKKAKQQQMTDEAMLRMAERNTAILSGIAKARERAK